ncbi:tryptophan halogenase [Candidatus Magnetomorum sp. HK-1]|nr:tryptophan halogenase [Candidatus Magnetomorum sp. HK-1]
MNSKKAENKANLLFKLLNNVQLEGTEASFKLSWKSFLQVRFLMGIRTKNLKINKLEKICTQLSIPKEYLIKIKQDFNKSNIILFGFEESENNCIYKVYLEFWDQNFKIVQNTSNPKNPLLQYIGFKWDAFDNLQRVITKYYSHPFIPVHSILTRIENIFNHKSHKKVLDNSKAIVTYAMKRIDIIKDPFIYLEVLDNKGFRNSFDINLYESELTIEDLKPYLYEIQKNFMITNHPFRPFLEQISSKILGHLSGGFDKKGDAFLTFYYDI